MVAQSIKDHWDMASMSDYGDYTYQYKDVARVIEKMHILYEQCGIKKGDRIALCGRNSARWGAAFFSILTYGAVAVPILNEFHPTQIQDIVNHSESRLLFVTDQIFATHNVGVQKQYSSTCPTSSEDNRHGTRHYWKDLRSNESCHCCRT